MTGVKITRVGELRKVLEEYSDNDFAYAEVTKQGGITITLASENYDNGESYIGCYPIITIPMTNRMPQDEIKKLEEISESLN